MSCSLNTFAVRLSVSASCPFVTQTVQDACNGYMFEHVMQANDAQSSEWLCVSFTLFFKVALRIRRLVLSRKMPNVQPPPRPSTSQTLNFQHFCLKEQLDRAAKLQVQAATGAPPWADYYCLAIVSNQQTARFGSRQSGSSLSSTLAIPGDKIWIKSVAGGRGEVGGAQQSTAGVAHWLSAFAAVGLYTFSRSPFLLHRCTRPDTMSLPGYFVGFSKCALLLSLRILFVVPAGLPVRSQGDSQSDNRVMDNITVRQGERVTLRWVRAPFSFHFFAWLSLPRIPRCSSPQVERYSSGNRTSSLFPYPRL